MDSEPIDYEAMPAPEARRIIVRAYLAGILLRFGGATAVLLAAGGIGAMLFDRQAYITWQTTAFGAASLLFIGGCLGWWLRGRRSRVSRETGVATQRPGQSVRRLG